MLKIADLSIIYPAQSGEQPAVDGVSFGLDGGEKLGLVGESGCGKSTIGKAILGLLSPSTKIKGNILYEGRSTLDFTPFQWRKFRGEAVGLVFQDPMTRLNPLMTIGDHCLETLLAHQPHLSRRQAQETAGEVLEKVRIPPNRWGQYAHEFSGGMRQRVAMALALLLKPRLIIADEPTTSLDVTVAQEILRELTRLCNYEGMGLLLISHDLALIGEYCDRVAVMYRGKIVESGKAGDIFSRPSHEYTRSLLASAFHVQVRPEKLQLSPRASTVLTVKGLKQYYTLEGNFLEQFLRQPKKVIKAVDDVSFHLYEGEIFGLVGESGCGKSTLSRTILGLIPPTEGEVEFSGSKLTGLTPRQMRSQRKLIQMIFQDPSASLNPLMTVGDSIADALLIHGLATPGEAHQKVKEMLERVGLWPVEEFYGRYPKQLSGGQQQRVGIARALITRPRLVICDEPVSMLDASIQSQVLDLMLQLKADFNLTYLFITHDLWLARYLCDRVAVMSGGKIVEMGNTTAIFDSPQHPYTQKLLQAAPMLRKKS
ncbi:MAG: Glutathione import ATP-binding protein GsiA [Chroococcopsis gigantea SAG 12.99]|jgi:peptide/nickel transport system ATP-binding protein|nr:ABC transporter ATP-binding protein [Chlorogloea purpurea SAG 13.99]MDV3000251.1 Glutathione import ATP-binding protein GsiA [Chroococcopsis gigantea SAG 12.99]